MQNLTQLSDATASAFRSVALPDVCRVEDLAHHLNISLAAIRSALRRGDLPGRRVGKRWLVSRQALLDRLAIPSQAQQQESASWIKVRRSPSVPRRPRATRRCPDRSPAPNQEA